MGKQVMHEAADGWTWVFRGNNKRSEKRIENPYDRKFEKIASTFYITNFPNHIDARGLWKTCERYGRIVDSYIANKLSKMGKRFGFVRFMGIENEEMFAQSLANIWIGNHHIYAAVARFQRSQSQKGVQKHNFVHKEVERKTSTFQTNHPNTRANNFPRSYASIVHGEGASTNTIRKPDEKKIVKLNDPESISVEDTTKTVLVKVKEVGSMINMHRICSSEGFSNVKVHHVGGLWTWLEFQTSDACLAFKTNNNLKQMFASIKPVQSNFVLDERTIWIEINGLPLCAWGSAALKKVANVFGKFMFFEYDHAQNMSIGRVCIATKYKKFIDEEISVEINGELFAVYVRELSNWSIKIEEENESDCGLSDNDQVENRSHSDEPCRQEKECDNVSISDHEDDMIIKDDTNTVNQHEHVGSHDQQEHVVKDDTDSVNQQEHVVTLEKIDDENQKHEDSNGDAIQSDTSCPPGFEFLKMQKQKQQQQVPSSPTISNCSTSFARYRKKDFKGTSLLFELNRLIEVRGTLGYDVRGCRKTLKHMLNGSGVAIFDR
ncbi:hypothetical protein CTI12_AA519540 [Artemisia annua]|uniref:RRM domain-containing protein n=1 Tax=Artemisia annua TaxID=35608 RepID=A0A2U1L8A0_ARTAN|nr:hypothetical protein CTI12_AA519540 [Artemisia annua]